VNPISHLVTASRHHAQLDEYAYAAHRDVSTTARAA
jgi:hypothetical protein